MSESGLFTLAQRAGLELPLLTKARESTARRLVRRAELVGSLDLPDDCTLIFVGSWGRGEVTAGSDNDFYVLVKDETTSLHPATMDQIKQTLENEQHEECADDKFRGPGRDGIFGDIVCLENLLKKIGQNHDTNENLTQRMLMVLESVALHNPHLHINARRLIIDNYLEEPIKANQPPRLFLNDVVRYWRTMCVDFAGKMRERSGEGWGLRNAKLRTSRKLLFASGLLPVLRCDEMDSSQIRPFLLDQFERRPADRVADAFLALDRLDEGAEVFCAYERFLQRLDSDGIRESLNAITSRSEADKSELFQSVVKSSDDVEAGLLALIFQPPLIETTRRFGIF